MRSSGSSLYGSDALGGVVSFFTKDPSDYLGGRQQFHLGAKTLYDSRSQEGTGNIVLAGGGPRVQSSLFVSYGSGHEVANKGDVETNISIRTAPNAQNRRSIQALAQYAGGFRAPPYSAVNSGFTNPAGGYTSIPNTELDAETSDNIEFGLRSATGPVSLAVTGFVNGYDNFILQVQRGVNPTTRLLEFQYQNLSRVNISGVEFQGEARLTDGLRLRASYAIIRGHDVSGPDDVPLDSIAPDQGALGLIYSARSNRWGSDVTVRTARGQSRETAGAGMFAPDGYGVADLVGWVALGRTVGRQTLPLAVSPEDDHR